MIKKTLRDKIYEEIAEEFVSESFKSGGEARRLCKKMWKVADKIIELLKEQL